MVESENRAPTESSSGPLASGMGRREKSLIPPDLQKSWERILAKFEELPPDVQDKVAEVLTELGKKPPGQALQITNTLINFFDDFGEHLRDSDPADMAQKIGQISKRRLN